MSRDDEQARAPSRALGWCLLALALWAHGLGLAGGFVYDDHRFVVQNTALERLDVGSALLDPATHTADRDRDVYRPLRALGHAFDLRRWGHEPFGFHLHSLLVHLATVWLAWRVLARLLPSPSAAPAAFGAGLLAVHPLGVEVVDWISSRGDQYALLAGLFALGWSLGPRPGWADVGRPGRWLHPVVATLAAGLATLGKESAAVLPLIAAAHAVLISGERRPLRLLRGVLPLATGVVLALGLRQLALAGLSPVQTPPHGGDWLSQVGWSMQGLWRLASLVAWPQGLTVDHPQDAWAAAGPVWSQARTWAGVALCVSPALLAVRGRRLAAFLALWALLAWLPSGSLLVTLRSLVTERSAAPLLPALGALLGLTLVGWARAAWVAGLVALCLGLGLVSRARVADFHDDVSLWTAALEVNPRSVQARLALAMAAPDADSAGAWLEQGLAVAEPGSKLEAVALARLGEHRLLRQGRLDEAVEILHRGLIAWERWARLERPGSDLADVRASLALALVRQHRYDEADGLLARALPGEQEPADLLVRRALLAGVRWSQERDDASRSLARQALEAASAASPGHPLLDALAQSLGD